MPIITCSGKRTPRVVKEITDGGIVLWLKVTRFRLLPVLCLIPSICFFMKAYENDLTHLKEIALYLENNIYFGDKIYGNVEFWEDMQRLNNSMMWTLVKDIKGQSELGKQKNKAYNDLFLKVVSSLRQLIESLFNGLIENN